jgi:pyruvate dehydrogenase E1 component beta subunit
MSRILNGKDAINEAIAQEMRRDKSVFIMGEDIAGGATHEKFENTTALGGAYGVTAGLVEEFGRKRVIDTPISETGFVGMGLGAALTGLRPIIEIMYVDFIGVCFDQVLNQAAKMFYMYGGKKPAPMVIRLACGAGYKTGAEHSQTLYAMFTAIPGLKVVTPSDPYEAKGLMTQAIRDNDPVIFLEHKKIYMSECEVPEEQYTIEFGKANVKKQGNDVTIVAIHKMVDYAMEAAAELESQGINAEVIDPRTLSPLDLGTLVTSTKKTGRLVIVDETYPRCGIASDISAQVLEQAFADLKAPIARVVPPHAHIPFCGPLEMEWVPNTAKIVKAVKETIEYTK